MSNVQRVCEVAFPTFAIFQSDDRDDVVCIYMFINVTIMMVVMMSMATR